MRQKILLLVVMAALLSALSAAPVLADADDGPVNHGEEGPVDHGEEDPVDHGEEGPVNHGEEGPVDSNGADSSDWRNDAMDEV